MMDWIIIVGESSIISYLRIHHIYIINIHLLNLHVSNYLVGIIT